MKMSIRKKILLCSLTPICLLGAIVIIIANTFIKSSIINQVEAALQGTAVATLAAYDQNPGSYLETANGDIWKGSYNISQSENLVDTIKAECGVDVTFFYGPKRIMTSAFDENNERILGTSAGEIIVETVLHNGQEFFSDNVSIDGTICYGYYVPVYQKGDRTTPIGMVFAGKNKEETLASVLKIIYSLILIVVAVTCVCIIAVGFWSTSLANILKKSIQSVQEVASGNLSVSFDKRISRRTDEVGDLTRAIKVLQNELRNIIGGIKESTGMLMQASDTLEQTSKETAGNINNVKTAIDTITQKANEQAEDTEKAENNVQHMGNLIMETVSETSVLSDSSDSMKSSSDKAAVTIDELKAISAEVKTAVITIAEQTWQTNESAKGIQEASRFISEIATEINLLGLNASIQAAQAGEASKGFSVVATQIQKLAEESSTASGSIDEIVNTLIRNSELVVNTMTRVQDVIDRQGTHIESTEQTVLEVMDEIKVSIHNIKGIESKTKELEELRKEVVNIIIALSDIAGDNVSNTKETNIVIKDVADSYKEVEQSAENVKNASNLLAQKVGDFTI